MNLIQLVFHCYSPMYFSPFLLQFYFHIDCYTLRLSRKKQDFFMSCFDVWLTLTANTPIVLDESRVPRGIIPSRVPRSFIPSRVPRGFIPFWVSRVFWDPKGNKTPWDPKGNKTPWDPKGNKTPWDPRRYKPHGILEDF